MPEPQPASPYPKVWVIVEQTHAEGQYQLYLGIYQAAAFMAFGTLDELSALADQIKKQVREERRREARYRADRLRPGEC